MIFGINDFRDCLPNYLPEYLFDEIANKRFHNFTDYLNQNNVTSLDLTEKITGPCDLFLVGKALKGTKVTHVILDSNNLANKALDFAESLKYTQVTHVSLRNNRIWNVGQFSKCLQNTNVTHLNFSANKINSQDAKDFAQNLKNTNVTHINLSDNNLGENVTGNFERDIKVLIAMRIDLSEFAQNLKNTNVIYVNLENNFDEKKKILAHHLPDSWLSELKSHISDAVQLNIATLLSEQEKNKFKNIKKNALKTDESQMKYAGGILMNPRLPSGVCPSDEPPHPYQPTITNQYYLHRRLHAAAFENPASPAPEQTLRQKNRLL